MLASKRRGSGASRRVFLGVSRVVGNGARALTGGTTDALYLLQYNFVAGPPPPFPECGPGNQEGDKELGCETPSCSV